MNIFKRYFTNTRTFRCEKCNISWSLTFWQWFFTLFHNHISGHAYVKCPFCGERHWRQCVKVVK